MGAAVPPVLMAPLPLLKQGNQVLLSFTALCQHDGTWHRAMPRCKSKSQFRMCLPPPSLGDPGREGKRGSLELSLSPKDPPLDFFFEAYGHLRDQATLISIGLMDSAQN